LIDVDSKKTLAEGGVEKVGLPGSFLKFKLPDGEKKTIEMPIPDHKKAINDILNILTDPTYGCIKSFDEINAVGHRVVHGGEKFNKSVKIDDEVIAKIKECYDVAPLHNPANMTGIEAITELMPGVPQVAVFDTAFHQTMPKEAYMMPFLMNFTRSMPYAATVSTVQATAMYRAVHVTSSDCLTTSSV